MNRTAAICDECKKPLDKPEQLKPGEYAFCPKCFDKLVKQGIVRPA